MEVLAGARDNDREVAGRRLLLRFTLLLFDVVADFDGAVRHTLLQGAIPLARDLC